MKGFLGVKRRQEVRGEKGGVTVLDDFAHHPTAVKVTLEALHAGYPGRRLWAIFEPRSATSRRRVFQQQYAEAFDLQLDLLNRTCPGVRGLAPKHVGRKEIPCKYLQCWKENR